MFFPKAVFASTNLLQNPGFEELFSNWEASSGLEKVSNFTISSYVKKSGENSALIKHGKTGSYGAQQIIRDIVGGSKYLGRGYVFFNNEDAKNARMRIAWYSSEDGSGSQIKTIDSNIVDTLLPSWQELDTGAIEAPTTAKSAEFRILLASNESGVESLVYFDDLSFELVQNSTPTPPNTSDPTLMVAIYKINDVKDEDGNTLSSVEVYVDEIYLHHYAPETLTFCDGCQCDSYVDCGFGEHTIRLEKSGYENWMEIKTINIGDSYEVNPVMSSVDSNSSPATSSQSSSTFTPSLKPIKVIGAILSGEILGEESTAAGFYPWEATEEGEGQEATENAKIQSLPKIIFVLGLIFLLSAAAHFCYNSRRELE
ncbi:MAG: hypothetical protein MUP45_02350 [Candidatus Marinimicrobia bacterium]|nr:hypothetical protein [Candidatus Neomarinimicrobiota bacterium]